MQEDFKANWIKEFNGYEVIPITTTAKYYIKEYKGVMMTKFCISSAQFNNFQRFCKGCKFVINENK